MWVEERWLTLGEVAALAGCHRATVHRACVAGELLSARTPYGHLVAESDATAWAEQRTQAKDHVEARPC